MKKLLDLLGPKRVVAIGGGLMIVVVAAIVGLPTDVVKDAICEGKVEEPVEVEQPVAEPAPEVKE